MRYALALAVAALFAPPALLAADPPVTFQTQPANRVLDDLRAAADLIGGERAVKAVNEGVKEKFGEKGLEGLDLNRPIVGYVVLAAKAEDITAVIAFPITTEKDFLGLCDRFNGAPPKDLGKGLYALPALDPQQKARLRFSDRYAYISHGGNPEPALDAKAIVPAHKLYDPADQAVFSGKFHFDRLTPEVKKAIPAYLAELKKELIEGGRDGAPGLGAQELASLKPLLEEIDKAVARYLLLLTGGDTAVLRVNLDVPAGELSVEAGLTGKPGTPLAKVIAARKPTANKFGSLLTPDTVAGFKTRLSYYDAELDAKVLEVQQPAAVAVVPNAVKPLVGELFKGLIRTVKTGEVDVVGGVRGPDKGGDFTGVVAVAFEDPAALEKEFKKVIESEAGAEAERFKWDADKLGKISIHTFKMNNDGAFLDFSKPFGGDKASVAFAFAPNGVFVVIGTDPVPVLKGALVVKPVESPMLDLVANPARLKKLVEKTGGRGEEVERAVGADDKLISALSLAITGGQELKVRFAMNLRLLPRAAVVSEERPEAAAGAAKK